MSNPNAFNPSSTPTGTAGAKLAKGGQINPAISPDAGQYPIPVPVVRSPESLRDLAHRLIKEKKFTQLITRVDGEDLPIEEFRLEGPDDGVIFLGHPFLGHDEEGHWQVPIFDLVGELKACYFDPETHCVVFVRCESYPDF